MSSVATPPSGWRVKLYQLNDEGQWDDRGTGSISVRMLEALGSVGVQVASEDGGSDLLSSQILEDREAYSLQGENIITWEERRPPPEPSIDLALSFQENEGCLQIWNQIQEVQGNYSTGAHPTGGDGELGEDDDEEDGPGGGLYASGAGVVGGLLRHHLAAELRALPEARVSNLAALRDQLTACAPMHRESYAAMLMDNEAAYLRKLVSLFGDLEDLEDEENLKLMAHVMKACVLLNEGRLLESLLTEPSLFAGVVGAIEYDPVLKQKATWRHFLDHEATFCEAVPMDDEPDLRNKIDLAFRAALLRDAVTRPGMDDNAISALVQYIYFAHSEILTSLHSTGASYLHKVLAACASNTGTNGQTSKGSSAHGTAKAAGVNGESDKMLKPAKGPKPGKARAHALRFLQEMCAMAKAGNVPMHTRDSLFNYLLNEAPLFEALTVALADDSLPPRERTAAAEVLAAVVTFDQATAFRLHVLQTGAHPPPPAWAQPQSAAGSGATTTAMATAPLAEAPAERGAADDDAAAAAFVAALEKSEGELAAADGSFSSTAQSPPLETPGALGSSGGSSTATSVPRPPSSTSLLSLVLFRLAHEDDSGCLLHYNEVLTKCIDTETMDASERDAFLTVFYDHYIHWLVDPLARDYDDESSRSATSSSSSSSAGGDSTTSSVVATGSSTDASTVAADISSSSASAHSTPTTAAAAAPVLQLSDAAKASRSHAVDLLAYCVRAHTYRMKFFVLRNNLVGRVLSLLKQPDKFLKLAALRFVRACVGAKDDFLNRHLVKKGHLSPVFALFAANGGRDNLLSSAVIDLVEFVRTENIKSLVEHIVGSFLPSFESVEYVTTFKSLVLRNEQNLEVHDDSSSGGAGGAGGSGVSEWRKARDAQEEDEAYFDADDDEVLPTGLPPLRGGGGGGGTDQHSPGADGGAGSGFGGGGPPPSLSAAGARSEAYERSTSGATSDGSTTGMCSSGSEAGSDSESESGSLSGAESPPPPTSPNTSAAAAGFKPVLKLSPAGPPRPSSPPISQQPPKDGLGRMFEMGHRIPTPTLPRTSAAAGANVRKIEILLPSSGSALEGTTSLAGGDSLTGGESSSGSSSSGSSSGVGSGAVPDEAAVLGTSSAGETSGDPDAKRQKV